MAVSVRIEDEAFADARVELLGLLAGYNRYEALGRLAHLWRLCTQRNTYVLSDALVAATLGDRGVDALLGAELGERADDGIRVRGTRGRIEWLAKLRANSKAGGLANRSQHIANGKPVPSQMDSQKGAKAKPKLSQEASQTGAKREPIGSVDNYTGEPLGYPIGYPKGSQEASQMGARWEPDAKPLPSPPVPIPAPLLIKEDQRSDARPRAGWEPSLLDSVAEPEGEPEIEPLNSDAAELSRMAADVLGMLGGKR